MADALTNALNSLQQQIGVAHSRTRELQNAAAQLDARHAQTEQQISRMSSDMRTLSDALSRVKGQGGEALTPEHIKYVEQIPGRRIPFDMCVSIPIGANITSEIQRTVVVSQDGPFIAVRRYAAFLSGMVFTYVSPTTGASTGFLGRSFGRWRPIHSAWDINDASASVINPTTGGPLPGAGQSIFASASNFSGFRTMEFDGYVKFESQGTAYPRQIIPIPTAFYTEQINSPFDLPSLDFFDKSEVLAWTVTPTHPNNPSYGNVSGIGTGGSFPFIASSYDVHEGINDPEINAVTTDPITRLPQGTLIIGMAGYRIYQPPGVVGSR